MVILCRKCNNGLAGINCGLIRSCRPNSITVCKVLSCNWATWTLKNNICVAWVIPKAVVWLVKERCISFNLTNSVP